MPKSELVVIKKKPRKKGEDHCWGCGRDDVHKDDLAMEHGPFGLCKPCAKDSHTIAGVLVTLEKLETPHKEAELDVPAETLIVREYVDKHEGRFKAALKELFFKLKGK